jgi:PPP family 3-phenylpropionic acid transporter
VTGPSPPQLHDRFELRLACFYAAMAATIGFQLPFFPLWLQARKLDPQAIGIVLAAPIVVRIVVVPVVNRVVDRFGALRGALLGLSAAAALAHALVGFAYGFAAVLATVALASAALQPCSTLADAYALKGLGARKRHYGPVRLWGSAAFVVAVLAGGALLDLIAADRLIWLIVAALGVMTLAGYFLLPLAPASAALSATGAIADGQDPAPRRAADHWSAPGFLAIAAAAGLIQASHAIYYGFSALDWTSKGLDSRTVGLLWAVGVIAEIALFALSGRLRIGFAALVAIGAAGAVLRWIVMALDPPFALLPLVQCLHGLSFGATHIGSVQFVARAAPEGRTAAAQGDFGTILAIVGAGATGCSGILYGAFGDGSYAAMAVLAALGGACVAVAWRRGRQARI